MPWSRTQNSSRLPRRRAPTSHRAPSGEYLRALSRRFPRIRPSRSRSVSRIGRSDPTVIRTRSLPGCIPSTTSAHSSSKATGPRCSLSASFCTCAAVRRFSISRSRRLPWRSIACTDSSRRTESWAMAGCWRVLANPMIVVSGVLSSCDTIATKSPFMRDSSRSSAPASLSLAREI